MNNDLKTITEEEIYNKNFNIVNYIGMGIFVYLLINSLAGLLSDLIQSILLTFDFNLIMNFWIIKLSVLIFQLLSLFMFIAKLRKQQIKPTIKLFYFVVAFYFLSVAISFLFSRYILPNLPDSYFIHANQYFNLVYEGNFYILIGMAVDIFYLIGIFSIVIWNFYASNAKLTYND